MKSLKQICISQIVNKFDDYYTAYCKIEDASLKLQFEFLRRVFSFEIITQLEQLGTFKQQYIQFLINRNLKILYTDWLKSCTWAFILKKFEEVGPSLEQVSFRCKKMPWKNVIHYLPNLRKVAFLTDADDDFLGTIAGYCPSVEVIDLRFSSVSNHGIEQLCHKRNGKALCPLLKELLVIGTNVDDDGIKNVLINLHSLEKIDYKVLPNVLYDLYKKDFLLGKSNSYNLTQLSLMYMESDCRILSEVLKTCMSMCPHLKTLSCPVHEQENLKLLSECHELEMLHLHNVNERPLDINDFLKLKGSKLEILWLCNISVSIPIMIQSCPHLNSLCIKGVTLLTNCTDNDLIPVFHNLERISVRGTDLTVLSRLKFLRNIFIASPNLKILCFRNCALLSNKVKEVILASCEQSKLTHVEFSFCKVDSIFLSGILLTCSSLKYLHVYGSEFSSEYTVEEANELKVIASTLPNKPIFLHNFKSYTSREYDASASGYNLSDSEDSEDYSDMDEDTDDDEYSDSFEDESDSFEDEDSDESDDFEDLDEVEIGYHTTEQL